MFVGIVTVPIYLHLVGGTRYGVLSLVWLFLGYFGLFDPGLSRAASYHIARLHNGPAKDRGSVFWTALAVNIVFGLVGGLVLYVVARPLFQWAFKMPADMRTEVMACLPFLAASIPISIISGVLSGALEAREWFGVNNSINVANTFASQLVPLAVAYFHGPDLSWLILAILLTRAIGAIPTFIAVTRALPLGHGGRFEKARLRGLFSYGGWITVTNFVNPLLTTMDRMLIGSVIGANAVAFYAVPFNLVSRVSVIPGALAGSLFPKLSRGSKEDAGKLASDAVISLAAVLTPLIVGGIVALPIFMRLWVGASFAAHAIPIGTVLFLGVWMNGLAYIPYGHLQASNRPDLTAKFHSLELLPFLGMLWFGLHCFGLIGAAWAWTLRVTVDALLLFGVAGQLTGWKRVLPGAVIVLIAPLCAPAAILSLQTIFAMLIIAVSIAWAVYVAPGLRGMLLGRMQRLTVRSAA